MLRTAWRSNVWAVSLLDAELLSRRSSVFRTIEIFEIDENRRILDALSLDAGVWCARRAFPM